jgi:hypothetical protein
MGIASYQKKSIPKTTYRTYLPAGGHYTLSRRERAGVRALPS